MQLSCIYDFFWINLQLCCIIKNYMKNELEEGNNLQLQFDKRGGFLPVAVQESNSGQILMLASVNPEALSYTIKYKIVAFFSTSKQKMWVKGETSGNYLLLDEILVDCDQDALVYKVTLKNGGVCHTFNQYSKNRKACFYRKLHLETETLEFIEK
jgi:phosphoribosyl-AMP cyclohydrolase